MVRLKESNVTNSKQMLRRWIRQGKIEATLQSKKEGYEIDPTSLELFIQEKQATMIETPNTDPDGGFQEGYKAGYDAAIQELSNRFKKMAIMGMFETQFLIERSEFREICSRRISKYKIKDFLKFTDKAFFAKQVKKPRSSVYCNAIGNYFYFQGTGLLIEQDKYETIINLELQYKAYEILISQLLENFINSNNVTSNNN